MKSTTQKSQELASVFCAWWKNAQINGPEQKSNEFVGYFLQKWHSSTSRDLKKKKEVMEATSGNTPLANGVCPK